MHIWFCYRWMPRTIFGNLSWAFYVFRRGIKNLWKWVPAIFWDTWYDWSSITRMLEFKFRDMSKNIKKYGCHVNRDRDARRLMICSVLCKRISEENYSGTPRQRIYSQQNDLAYLCKLMNKHLYTWWD